MLLTDRGLLARLFRPLFGLITRSWHMFPLGFLFGLGFDTATEVALLGLSATQAAKGVSLWSILVFPALFAAGMALVDTTDGVLMLGAYNWAFVKPIRKLYYNLTITLVSVVVAVLIGGIELLGLVGDRLGLSGWFWRAIGGSERQSATRWASSSSACSSPPGQARSRSTATRGWTPSRSPAPPRSRQAHPDARADGMDARSSLGARHSSGAPPAMK